MSCPQSVMNTLYKNKYIDYISFKEIKKERMKKKMFVPMYVIRGMINKFLQ